MNKFLFIITGFNALVSVAPLLRRSYKPLVYNGFVRTIHNRNKNDFIDVEIIDDKNKNNNNKESIKRSTISSDNNIIDTIKQKASNAITSITNFFDRDDEKTKRKKQVKKQMNTEIDTMLKGTGIVGGVFGSVIKSVGGMMMDSMADAANDIADIQDQIIVMLNNDEKCYEILGGPSISASPPFSTSSSSMNINGEQRRRVAIAFQVQGSKSSGQIETQASFSGNAMNIDEAILRTNTGFIIKLRSGGRGGNVIDVDTL